MRAPTDAALAEHDAVQAGTHILCVRAPGRCRAIAWADGRWLRLSLRDDLRFEHRQVLNPHALVCDAQKVRDQLLFQRASGRRAWALAPVTPGLAADLAAVAGLLSATKEEVVLRYLAHIQRGGTISGGPTTDQRWTVRWDGEGYTISSSRPGEGERPLAEAELRRMLTGYHMFGLHRLED